MEVYGLFIPPLFIGGILWFIHRLYTSWEESKKSH